MAYAAKYHFISASGAMVMPAAAGTLPNPLNRNTSLSPAVHLLKCTTVLAMPSCQKTRQSGVAINLMTALVQHIVDVGRMAPERCSLRNKI